MKETKTLDYKLVNEAFEREGWVMYHQFMAGNRYEKGNDIVTWYFGRFMLNGKSVSETYICEMLHMDSRMIHVSGAISPHSLFPITDRLFLQV